MREPDFTGWATVYNTLCDDGRTIKTGAFSEQDGQAVPLMYQHNHKDPEMIIGHCALHSIDDGVWCEGYLNDSPKGVAARKAAQNRDVTSLSIWANDISEVDKVVYHGIIREVQIVLAGANPKARIEYTSVSHSGEPIDSEAVIYSGMEFDYGIQHESEADVKEFAGELLDYQEFVDSNPTVETLIAAYQELPEEEMKLMNAGMSGTVTQEIKDKLDDMISKKDLTTRVKLLSLLSLAADKE